MKTPAIAWRPGWASTWRSWRTATPRTSTKRCISTSPVPTLRNDLNHWLPLVKWLLAMPHYVVLWQRNLGCLVMLERS
jgi:hypothetical protein